jgi:hypothetical protein
MRSNLLKLLLCAAAGVALPAQNRMTYPIVAQDSGHVALGLALRKLTVATTFMQAPAHPDDETNALFALFGYGMGMRTIDVQNNRGEGGQNEIGPELFHDIGVLRTSELLSAHRIDGAEQYFTRAIDYGYSFDPEEVIGKWGRKEIVGDYVRFLRTFRPDVLVTMNIQGRGGDRAHEATTVLVREAYRAAGDPNMYPEQLREGLRPWQPRKLYFSAGFGGPGGGRGPAGAPAQAAPATPAPPAVKLTPVNTAAWDSLLGRTYAEIGTDARSNHKCQGMGGLGPIPGMGAGGGRGAAAADGGGRGRGGRATAPATQTAGAGAAPAATPPAAPGGGRGGFGPGGYQLMESTIDGQKGKDEASFFDGIDTSLAGVAKFAGANPPEPLTRGLAEIVRHARTAQAAFAAGEDNRTAAPIGAGLTALRSLRSSLAGMGLSDSARYEIDFRLRNKERDYEDALLAALGLVFDAQADDGLVVAGQPIRLSFSAVNRGAEEVGITAVDIAGFDSPTRCEPGVVKKDAVFACTPEAHIPADAQLTTPYFHDNYWKHPESSAINVFDPGVPFGVPFAPTPFHATFHVRAGDVEVTRLVPVQFRYVKDIFYGDKRMELNVVPAFSARVTPSLAVVPAGAGAAEREIHISVTSGLKSAAKATVALELPAGWKASPASAPLDFTHEDESLTARFLITPPPGVKAGEYTLRAVVTSPAVPGRRFDNGYQEIDYPHIQRRQVIKPAEAALKVIDVKPAPHTNVGFIVGAGDQVPQAIEQLGAKVSLIEPDELAWGDLSRYDMIMTGVRAYERRADLRAYNHRLLDYVEHGGTVIVEYNKMEFNREDYGPFPAKVSGNRVTDETAPVKVLQPTHPLFNYPNKIGDSAWAGWVQERGLYFLGDKDKQYTDLVAMTDPFKDNPGEKLGALVEGRYGKGRWLYVGLGLWRQLPAGTDGAYQLLANLLALPKEPSSH